MQKVMIVDDENNVRRLVAATLAGGEYELIQARDGTQALEMARREQPSLVLLDVQMPGIDGIEVCRQIKADPNLRQMVVVMLTAQAQADIRQRAIAAGADMFLTKPFSPLQVLEIVERKAN
jgi:two-component system phosphate regulon response regulator PhoB